ncbi:MAG: thioredoxin family protein [Anaerolineales bacterium]|nr:thioredoxin family protein [Anaerolineales bacterium]
MDILIRAIYAALIAVGAWLLYAAWRRWRLARLQTPHLGGPQLGLESWRGDGPAILYFTTPDCVPCKTQQQPELRRLVELDTNVQVIEIDATQQPKVADYWGVLSVPTTFVINSRGQARAMNPGVARADKLLRQLAQAEQPPDEADNAKPDATNFVKYQGRIE